MASGSSLAFQRLSRDSVYAIRSVRLAETRFRQKRNVHSVTESRKIALCGIMKASRAPMKASWGPMKVSMGAHEGFMGAHEAFMGPDEGFMRIS
eukprot:gene10432-biopygen10822